MSEDPEKSNTAMATWQEWQEAPWGRLRYAVAEANLTRHLDGPEGGRPLRVLDLAGGDGGDALRLAARGHHVTVVDYAPATAEEVIPVLRDLGCRDVRHYGIRNFCDYITDDARKYDQEYYDSPNAWSSPPPRDIPTRTAPGSSN